MYFSLYRKIFHIIEAEYFSKLVTLLHVRESCTFCSVTVCARYKQFLRVNVHTDSILSDNCLLSLPVDSLIV